MSATTRKDSSKTMAKLPPIDENKKSEDSYFSSPIISPKNLKGYYLHIPPYDQKFDCARLAIDSIDDYVDENSPPKVYEVRRLKSDKIVLPSPPSPIFLSSANTSSSSVEEIKTAERQVFQQDYPARFSTIDSVFNLETNRHYHFNKLKDVMKIFQGEKKETSSSDSEKNYVTANEDIPSPRHSSSLTALSKYQMKDRPLKYNKRITRSATTTANVTRHDSSEVVRYTLFDKEMSRHNTIFSTSELENQRHHQRLNHHDEDRKKEESDFLNLTPTNDSTEKYIMNDYNNVIPPTYHSYVTQQPTTLTNSTYYNNSYSSGGSEQDRKSSTYYAGTTTTDSHYSSMYNQHSNNIIQQYNSPYIPSYNESERNKGAIFISSSPPSSISSMNEKSSKMTTPEKTWVPYFTYLTTVVMFAYFAVSIVYNFKLTGNVIQISPFNVMVGPSSETLIYTGARYIPCMKSTQLYPVTESIYTCPRTPGRGNVTKPIYNDQRPLRDRSPFMSQQYLSTAEDNCDLQNACGGTSFRNPDKPDQGYRFISALFIHSGILQLLINIVVHIKLGSEVEKKINPYRYSAIWLVSGVFGYIFGAVFVPEGNVSVGCSVALMGVMAFLFIDLIRNWSHINHPYEILLNIVSCFVISMAIGLLPGYDNFAHIGGFIGGLMITLVVLPIATVQLPPSTLKNSKLRISEQTIQLWLMRIMAIAFTAVLIWIILHIFFEDGDQQSCRYCQYFSCIPISDMCSPYSS